MPTTDPVTLLVTSYVMPAAMTDCLFWSAYLVAVGGLTRREVGRRPEFRPRP
jgi:hypothetical protein